MATPLRPKTPVTRIKENTFGVAAERRKPLLPGPYIYVSQGTGDTAPLESWQSPPWLNSFTQFGTRYVGFRHGLDGDLEFIGSLDLTQGAVTGTVAFVVPTAWRAISFEFPFPIFTGGTDWETGICQVDSANGNITIYWPTQATLI